MATVVGVESVAVVVVAGVVMVVMMVVVVSGADVRIVVVTLRLASA